MRQPRRPQLLTLVRLTPACLAAVIAMTITTSLFAPASPPGPAESSKLTESSAPPEPAGALAAFTSHDPAVARARQLVDEGKFSQAEDLLRQGGGAGPDGLRPSPDREQTLDLIGRIRVAYALGADGLLDRLRESIPDVTADDLERWRRAGQVQFRTIDGRVAYFGREPANVFRFCDEAKRRRRDAPDAARARTSNPAQDPELRRHLERVIAAAAAGGAGNAPSPNLLPVRHRVKYSLTLPAGAPHAEAGATVRVWLPFPQEYRGQRDVKLLRTSPVSPALPQPAAPAPAATGGDPVGPLHGAPQRTVYFETRVPDPPADLTFEEEFEFTSSAYYPDLDDAKARPLPADWAGGNLAERPPHILFTPRLSRAVADAVGGETNPLARARAIFHYVADHVAYCAEEEYGTIPGLSEKALASGRGDCGVQSMLFIAMCRRAGIPARWHSGWQTRPGAADMHDWCEFYVEPWGWLPADPSYGPLDAPDPAVRDFYLGHLDAYRLIVCRDYGSPLVPPKSSPRSEPLDFQRGEVEVAGHNLYFPDWSYDIAVEYPDLLREEAGTAKPR